MIQLLRQTRADIPSLSINAGFIVDYVRVQGSARNLMRKRFGSEMRDFIAETSQLNTSVRVGLASDTGSRPRSQDSVIVMQAHLDDEHVPIPMILAAVADGVGGHAAGDVTSGLAIQTLAEHVADRLANTQAGYVSIDPISIETLLVEAFSEIHYKIRARTTGGASTLTCALIIDRTAYVAHVGDSRAYLIEPGSEAAEPLTRDHRFVREWEELGIITADEAKHHPQRHILYRALGKLDQCEVDITRRHLADGARLLLCTDGIWETVGASELHTVTTRAKHPQGACEGLLTIALANNAHDDITSVLVEIPA